MQENGKHLPWKFESLEKDGQEQQNGGEEASQQDFDPTKFILVDKEVIQKIDVMKSKYNLFFLNLNSPFIIFRRWMIINFLCRP